MSAREAAEQATLRWAVERGLLSEPAARAAQAELARLRAAGAARELLPLLRERLSDPQVRELEQAYLRALGAAPTDATVLRPLAPAARPWVPTARPRRLGPYELGEELARGGMGAVFVARHLALGRKVAVKVVLGADPEALQRFGVEARAAARLRHPNIVAVHEVGTDQGQSFIAMDLIEGESLKARIEREGPLAPELAAELVEKLARALEAAHAQGVLHRDLKPSNVMIDRAGEPLVTDFGLAKAVDEALSLTATGQMLGTPAYMPPEQVRGQKERVDARSDVYALGATLFEALTGAPPFAGYASVNVIVAVVREPPPRPSALRPGLDPALEAICLRCLEKEPERRYPSAAALAAALAAWRAGERPGPVGAPPPPPSAASGRGALRLVLAAAAAFLAGALLPRGADPAALERAWSEASRALAAALAAEPGPAGDAARAEARAALARAGALAPDAAGPREGLAALELAGGRAPDPEWSALADQGPRTPAGHYVAGRLAEAGGRTGEALAAYRAALAGGCPARDLALRLARAEARDADARGWRRTAEEARWRALASAPDDLAPLAELVEGWLAAGAADALADGWSALHVRFAGRELEAVRAAEAPRLASVVADPGAPLTARVAAALEAARLPSGEVRAALEAARRAPAPLLREAARASLLGSGARASLGAADPLAGAVARWAAAAAADAESGPAAALTLLEVASTLGPDEAAALDRLAAAPSPALRAACALALAVAASRGEGLPVALANARLEPLRADPEPAVAAAAAAAHGALALLRGGEPGGEPSSPALRLAGCLLALPGADPSLDAAGFEAHLARRTELAPAEQLAAAERLAARSDGWDVALAAAREVRAAAPASLDAAALAASLAVLGRAPGATFGADPLAVPGADPLALEEARARLAFAARHRLLALPAPHGRLRVIAVFGGAAPPHAADGIELFAGAAASGPGFLELEDALALVTAFSLEGLRSIRLVGALSGPLRLEAHAPRSLLAPADVSLALGGEPAAATARVGGLATAWAAPRGRIERLDLAFDRAALAAWQDGARAGRAPLRAGLGAGGRVRLLHRGSGRLIRLELVGTWREPPSLEGAAAPLVPAPADCALPAGAPEGAPRTLGELASQGVTLRARGGGGEQLGLPRVRGDFVLRARLRFAPERERAAGVRLRLGAAPEGELRVLWREHRQQGAPRSTRVTVELATRDGPPPVLLAARPWSSDASWLVLELERRADRLAVRIGPDPEHVVEVLGAPLYLPRSASPLEVAWVAFDPGDPAAPASARFDQVELRTVAMD